MMLLNGHQVSKKLYVNDEIKCVPKSYFFHFSDGRMLTAHWSAGSLAYWLTGLLAQHQSLASRPVSQRTSEPSTCDHLKNEKKVRLRDTLNFIIHVQLFGNLMSILQHHP